MRMHILDMQNILKWFKKRVRIQRFVLSQNSCKSSSEYIEHLLGMLSLLLNPKLGICCNALKCLSAGLARTDL